jgi:hypothetical protein
VALYTGPGRNPDTAAAAGLSPDGYPAAFAVAAVLPLAAAALVPVAALEVTAQPEPG